MLPFFGWEFFGINIATLAITSTLLIKKAHPDYQHHAGNPSRLN